MGNSKDSIKKHGFTKAQYRAFASSTGQKITFNRRCAQLADHYQVSIYYLGPTMEQDLCLYPGKRGPIQLIDAFLECLGAEEDMTLDGIIARRIKPTTLASFKRFGDKNCLSRAIKRHYVHKEGTALDVQVQSIESEFSVSVTPDDLIAFIYAHEQGPKSYCSEVAQTIEDIQSDFKALLGFNLYEDFARQFEAIFLCKSMPVREVVPF